MGRAPAGVCLACATLLAVPGVARAQGLLEGVRGALDTTVSSSTVTVTNTVTGEVTTTKLENFFPRLTVNTDAMVFPSLRLSTGGVFETNALFSPEDGRDTRLTRLRPYVELRSTNPVFAPGVSYYRRSDRSSTSGFPAFGLVSEDYVAYLGWRPAGLPQTEFQFVRTNTRDDGRETLDTTRDLGTIISRYSYKNLNVHYLGSSLENVDRLHQVENQQTSNAARIDYSQSFLQKRLLWNTTYNANHIDITTRARGEGGEVEMPVFATAGLSLSSDTPVTARLAPNALVSDGNLTAAAGINLGLPTVGADSQARNIGLDFLNPTEVNRLLVWVDRDLPIEISSAFSWEIYSSPDNLLWAREAVVATATFGPFENRFRVDFRSVTARYLKVVVRPLSVTARDASRFPDIFVTELQAMVARPAAEAEQSVERTTQNFNTDVRFRILEGPALYYEGSYWFNDAGTPGTDRHLLSNGVSVNHRFNRMVGAYGRAALEQGELPEGERTALVTNATLTFEPTHTFTGSLLYTGLDESLDDRSNDRHGISLHTSSQVYRGVDVQFGFGWNFLTRETGEELRDRFVNVTASLVPRPNLTMTVSYADTRTARSGAFSDLPEFHSRRTLATVAYDPVRSLHLVLAAEILAGDIGRTRAFTNVGVNWSPFPDGTLQFFLTYNESLRPLEYGTERNFRPGLRWRFARQSYVDLSYEALRTEFSFQKTETEIVVATLRLFF